MRRPETVASADLVGFGSGIYFGNHHKTLLAFAESLPVRQGGRAFVFSTSGRGGTGFHRKLNAILASEGLRDRRGVRLQGLGHLLDLQAASAGSTRAGRTGSDLEDAAAFARGLAGT